MTPFDEEMSAFRWRSAEAVAGTLRQAGVDWAICNGIDVDQRSVGRDVDLWVRQADVARARDHIAGALRNVGWPSVWYRYCELLHQLVAFRIVAGRPVTLAFDLMADPDFWSTRGISLAGVPADDERRFEGPFVFSDARMSIKTRIMPLLRGDFAKFIDGRRRVTPGDFETLVGLGLVGGDRLARWLRKHEALFDSDEHDRAARRQTLEDASRDLRRLLWTNGLSNVPRGLKAYLRKTAHYSAAPFQCPPISLAVGGDVPALADRIAQEADGTYLDVLGPRSIGRRMLPMRPGVGLTIHLSEARRPESEVALARDAWGFAWRSRLGGPLPPEVATSSDAGVYRAVQHLLDAVRSA